jgi:predicted nucleic acid-binding protein
MVVHYFLLTSRLNLLADALDPPVVLPRLVYDPDDPADADDRAVSEITRGVRYFRQRSRSQEAGEDERLVAARHADRLASIQQFVDKSLIEIADMTDQELVMFANLTSKPPDDKLPRLLPLGAGEAACVAIGVHRHYTVATDDSDALRVLEHLSPAHPYERIRKLLIRAAEQGLIEQDDANNIHAEMRSYGFRDTTTPFPVSGRQ